ncbi:hypothetical protein D7D52_37045 [Nocardia yunnanensis]|uniref:Uncharacterized protein n=1 Tax=Nocardia yunnanensis TaxID=2382165 RepID=A0A386ZP85_9NOCA|nr:hypothetical protein [Nocardia yunnanensis]AYF78509.1 hypothetical protein D7D52_37045 [Nocardia yunnanensis]
MGVERREHLPHGRAHLLLGRGGPADHRGESREFRSRRIESARPFGMDAGGQQHRPIDPRGARARELSGGVDGDVGVHIGDHGFLSRE